MMDRKDDHHQDDVQGVQSSTKSSSSSMLRQQRLHEQHHERRRSRDDQDLDLLLLQQQQRQGADDDDARIAVDPREQRLALLARNNHAHAAFLSSPSSSSLAIRSTQSSLVEYISKSPIVRFASNTAVLFYNYNNKSNPKNQENATTTKHISGQDVLLLREDHVVVSLDQLNPSASSRTRKSSFGIAVVNLVATVCGGGVLSLPLAFDRAGIVPTTTFLVLGAAITEFSLLCLVDAARKTGGRTYGDVAAAAFGTFSQVITTFMIGLMLCGTLIAYQVLVMDIWTPVVFFLLSMRNQNNHNDKNMQDGAAPDHYYGAHSGAESRKEGGMMIMQDDDNSSSNNNNNTDDNDDDNTGGEQGAVLLLAVILILAMPLLVQKDLHALRHTCYIGFSSCVLLMMAVVYRATEKLMMMASQHQDDDKSVTVGWGKALNWYSNNLSDYLFAFPIVILCYFCSYNVLAVHSSMVHPTRPRIQLVLGLSMWICCFLFLAVGLFGYLYTHDTGTPDNILLAFDLQDKAILAGRMGFCLTLLFGFPLVLLPCREALVSVPNQVRAWRRDAELVAQFQKLNETYQAAHDHESSSEDEEEQQQQDNDDCSKQKKKKNKLKSYGAVTASPHLVINGVDFDGAAPMLITTDPERRHGTSIVLTTTTTTGSASVTDTVTSTMDATTVMSSEAGNHDDDEDDELLLSPTHPLLSRNDNDLEQQVKDQIYHAMMGHGGPRLTRQGPAAIVQISIGGETTLPRSGKNEQERLRRHSSTTGDDQHNPCSLSSWCDLAQHVLCTVGILIPTYVIAIVVPGVAAVWSIVGSSMAIWIAFIVPTACFLRIRSHKGLTMQALYAWLLLAFSCVAMVVCTRQAVLNAFGGGGDYGGGDDNYNGTDTTSTGDDFSAR